MKNKSETVKWINKHFNVLAYLPMATVITAKGTKLTLAESFIFTLRLLQKSGKICFIGNGGSAGLSSHFAVDYMKNGGMKSMAFNDPIFLTCMGNDFGYENVFSKQAELYMNKNDTLIAISSSGKSPNILKACEIAKKKKCRIITLSGFKDNNPLRKMGDINFYVPATDYGLVEGTHFSLLHSILDYSMGLA